MNYVKEFLLRNSAKIQLLTKRKINNDIIEAMTTIEEGEEEGSRGQRTPAVEIIPHDVAIY